MIETAGAAAPAVLFKRKKRRLGKVKNQNAKP